MDAMRGSLPTVTVTFLFTDVEGSTRLLQTLGSDYRGVLERHAAIVREALAAHDGIEISTEGDAFCAVFQSAIEAVEAAVDAQRGLARERWPDGNPLRVRMGLHTGEGRLGGDSYVGLDVHRAARIAAAGRGGQVLLVTPRCISIEAPPLILATETAYLRATPLDNGRITSRLAVNIDEAARVTASSPQPMASRRSARQVGAPRSGCRRLRRPPRSHGARRTASRRD